MKWVYYIPTPPLKCEFMMFMSKNIRVYRFQQQGYGHTLVIIHVQKSKERGKTTWGKYSLKKGQGTKFEQYVFNVYLSSLE